MTLSDAKEVLMRYYEHGIPPGGFLTAVLENDLFEALARADPTSRWILADIVNFIAWKFLANSHGNPLAVRQWIEQGGMEGGRARMREKVRIKEESLEE